MTVTLGAAAQAGEAAETKMADRIRGEFWVRSDLLELVAPGSNLRSDDGLSERERAALELLLEDARWVFSGMIYGFNFNWTPSSLARAVEEELSISPIALIPRGDPNLRTISLTKENGFVYVQLEYLPDESQAARLRGWAGNRYPSARGVGFAEIGPDTVRQATEAAIKETVRSYLRSREFNRPRAVSGRVALLSVPETGLRGGGSRASVNLRLDLEAVRPYGAD